MNKTDLKLKFVSWFHMKHPGRYCWADCVTWALTNRWNPFKIETSKGCELESKEGSFTGSCYCGEWNNGVCWSKLPKTERDKIISDREKEWEALDKPPF